MGHKQSTLKTQVNFKDFTMYRFTEVYGCQLTTGSKGPEATQNPVYTNLTTDGVLIIGSNKGKHGMFFVYGKCSDKTRIEELTKK